MNVARYLSLISPSSVASITGKKAHEDPQLICDIQTLYGKLYPTLVQMDMPDAIKWLLGWSNYIRDKNGYTCRFVTHQFIRGDLVLCDLFGHFGHELTYSHPAMVLANGYNWVLIAPISSPAYGDQEPLHIDLQPAHGVANNCGVLLDNIRVISKNRIINSLGRVSLSSKLDEIDEAIRKHFTPALHTSSIQDKQKIESLETKVSEQEEQINGLDQQVSELMKHIERLERLKGLSEDIGDEGQAAG